MKPVETVLRKDGRGRNIEGVNQTEKYCKHKCEYFNVYSS
jgi:hypothetical protein